jgi:hypothetical protein
LPQSIKLGCVSFMLVPPFLGTFEPMAKRNWNWTLNRRLRRFGWELGRYPKNFFVFELHAEFERMSASKEDLRDLAILAKGYSLIFMRMGCVHSQLGQEAFVVGMTDGAENLKYLELGAFDPQLLSNTATLRNSFNWTGLSVDPNPEVLEKFKSAKLESGFLNVGVAGKDVSAILIKDGALSYTQPVLDLEIQNSELIQLVSIKKIVENLSSIDYLSIDIEGGELEVLTEFPFERIKPSIITVEHNFREKDLANIRELLCSKGYRPFLPNRTDFESWYVLETLLDDF